MRGFLALLRKEWNDVRVITFACMALVVGALLVVRWLMQQMTQASATDPNWGPRHLEFVVPFAVGGFVTLAAADLVGREVESRRIDALALLPARPLRIWTAKAMVLVATIVSFAAWAVLAQVMVLWLIDGISAAFPFLARWDAGLFLSFPIAALAGATLLVSSVGFRGIAAAFLGVLVTGALFGLAYGYFLHIGIPERNALDDERIVGVSVTIVIATFIAAAAVYSRGRLHLGKKLRPALGAVATFGLVAIVPAAAYPHALYACDPRDPMTKLVWALPSPDGRSLACTFYEQKGGVYGAALHVLDVETGVLREIGTRASCDVPPGEPGSSAWTDATHLRVLRHGFSSVRHDVVDTVHGTVVEGSTESLEEFRARQQTAQPTFTPSRWSWVNTGKVRVGDETMERVTLRRTSDRKEFNVLSFTMISPSYASDTVVLCPDRHRLVERDFETGADRVVLTCEGRIQTLWHTGLPDRTVFLRIDDAWEAVRLGDGHRVKIESGPRIPVVALCAGSGRRLVWLSETGSKPPALLDIDSRDRLEGNGNGHLAALPDGRLVMTGWDGTCHLLDAHLKIVKRLWPQAAR